MFGFYIRFSTDPFSLSVIIGEARSSKRRKAIGERRVMKKKEEIAYIDCAENRTGPQENIYARQEESD